MYPLYFDTSRANQIVKIGITNAIGIRKSESEESKIIPTSILIIMVSTSSPSSKLFNVLYFSLVFGSIVEAIKAEIVVLS